jgi:pilus assembly protein CpaB
MEGLTLNRGNRGLLLIAMFAGLAAAVLVFVALAQGNGGDNTSTSTSAPAVKTVVAAQAIPAGTKITAAMVKVAEFPENVRVNGAFGDTVPVVGEVATFAIAEGEALTPAKIGRLREGNGLSEAIGLGIVLEPGMRAIAMRVEEVTAVGGNLIPGDRVDVVAVYEMPGGAVVAQTILQNIEVLSVAQEALKPLPAGQRDADGDRVNDTVTSGVVSEDVKQNASAVTVTLAVSPEQAQMLAYAQEEANKVYTSLRSFGDQTPVDLPPIDAIGPR